MNRARDERGLALVEAPICMVVVLLLMMGVVTLTQVIWTHMDLAEAARDAARYATRVEYDPSATTPSSRRHRTVAEVQAWAALVAAEAGVDPDDVTIADGDGVAIQNLEDLRTGDKVTVTITRTVDNPLYATAAGITNAMAGLLRAGRPFDPQGVVITAEAETYVE